LGCSRFIQNGGTALIFIALWLHTPASLVSIGSVFRRIGPKSSSFRRQQLASSAVGTISLPPNTGSEIAEPYASIQLPCPENRARLRERADKAYNPPCFTRHTLCLPGQGECDKKKQSRSEAVTAKAPNASDATSSLVGCVVRCDRQVLACPWQACRNSQLQRLGR
jgi:hypothetical protein